MEGYEKLRIYNISLEGVKVIHEFIKSPLLKREFWLVDQISRAAVSVPINIAEGYGRRSKKDFAHFISIAIGSINEVKALLDSIQTIYPSIQIDKIKSFYNELGKQTFRFRQVILKEA